MVVKYADNIQKNFANALSVALTVLGAAPLFGLWPSPWFLVGVAATLLSAVARTRRIGLVVALLVVAEIFDPARRASASLFVENLYSGLVAALAVTTCEASEALVEIAGGRFWRAGLSVALALERLPPPRVERTTASTFASLDS